MSESLSEFLETANVHLVPVTVNGKSWPGYYVDKTNGDIYSTKTRFKKMVSTVAGQSPYPRIKFSVDGKPFSFSHHRVVCETLKPIPIPPNVPEEDWKKTPSTVKACFTQFWQVNHIDHNHVNYHPDNLEWVSPKENVDKYQYVRKLGT